MTKDQFDEITRRNGKRRAEQYAREWIAANPHTALRLALTAHAAKDWGDAHVCIATAVTDLWLSAKQEEQP